MPTDDASPPGRRRALLLAAASLTAPRAFGNAPRRLRVAAAYLLPVESPWASRVHKALNTAVARGEIEYRFVESVPLPAYEATVRELARANYDLIIAEAYAFDLELRKLARAFPRTMFLLGSIGRPQPSNVSVFDAQVIEPAYLSGLLAGTLTRSRRIGLVGGFPTPSSNRLMNAFIQGARESEPKVAFGVLFIRAWFDPPKARAAAEALIGRGADVLYADLYGVSEVAREQGKPVIGSLVDRSAQDPNTVLASAVWHVEPTIDAVLAALRRDGVRAEDYTRYSTLANKGAELALPGPADKRIAAPTRVRLQEAQAALIARRITLRADGSEPRGTL